MSISKRLKLVASMVTKGNIVADVGTDHGYVPIYLLKENICDFAYAMDINKGPIDRAREHVEQEGLADKVELIHCDGMKGLDGKDVDTVIIAGMGGELVCKIIDESPVIDKLKELVLSPHSDIDKVRQKVMDKGFEIVDETMIMEFGKYYNVIKAHRIKKDSDVKLYSKFELLYSKVLFQKKDEVFGNYLQFKKEKLERLIEMMNANNQAESDRTKELKEELNYCNKAIDLFRA